MPPFKRREEKLCLSNYVSPHAAFQTAIGKTRTFKLFGARWRLSDGKRENSAKLLYLSYGQEPDAALVELIDYLLEFAEMFALHKQILRTN
jgi:hypothetical protein